MTIFIDELGQSLRRARKQSFPKDSVKAFATRCDLGLSTFKKMEKGDLSVGLINYYKAATILGTADAFTELFKIEENWFDE